MAQASMAFKPQPSRSEGVDEEMGAAQGGVLVRLVERAGEEDVLPEVEFVCQCPELRLHLSAADHGEVAPRRRG